MGRLMSIEECERVISNHKSGIQLTQVSLYQQLADTMRENERIKDILECYVLEDALNVLGYEKSYKHPETPLGSPVRYTDGSISREYDEQPIKTSS